MQQSETAHIQYCALPSNTPIQCETDHFELLITRVPSNLSSAVQSSYFGIQCLQCPTHFLLSWEILDNSHDTEFPTFIHLYIRKVYLAVHFLN